MRVAARAPTRYPRAMSAPESIRLVPGHCRHGAFVAGIAGGALVGLSLGDGTHRSDRWQEGAMATEDTGEDMGMAERLAKALDTPGAASPLPLRPAGTPFQQAVWAELQRIPLGQTRSYADIAAALGKPGAERAVGTANGSNPIAVFIPCHRVIRADGRFGDYRWGRPRKRLLLGLEATRAG